MIPVQQRDVPIHLKSIDNLRDLIINRNQYLGHLGYVLKGLSDTARILHSAAVGAASAAMITEIHRAPACPIINQPVDPAKVPDGLNLTPVFLRRILHNQ